MEVTKYKLTDVCDFQGGSQPPKREWSKKPKEGFIRMLQIRDFTQPAKINVEYVKKTSTTKICETNDILIGRYGASVGKILTGLEGTFNVAIMKTIPKKSKLIKPYLYQLLKGPSFQNYILNVGGRAAQAGFSKDDLSRFNVFLPSLDNQKRIAQVLTDCEELIAKRKESITLLDDLLKSTFLEMFGDPIQMSTKKLDKFSRHINFLTSGSRGWAKFYSDKGSKFLRIQNLGFGILNEKDTQYVSPPVSAESKRTKVQEGDLLLSITADLGRTAVIPRSYGDAYINQHLALIRLKKSLNPIYAAFYFAMPFGNRMIQKKDKDGVKSGLNFTDIRNFDVFTPNLEKQEKFVEIVKGVEKTKELYQKHLTELENLYGGLSQDSFKGELDLSKVVLKVEFLEENQFFKKEDSTDVEIESNQKPLHLFDLEDVETYLENLIKKNYPRKSFVFKDIQTLLFEDFKINDFEDSYDSLKNQFFKLLKKDKSEIIQYFDEDSGTIKFKLKYAVN